MDVSPWPGSPEVVLKKQAEPASIQCSSVVSASVPASAFFGDALLPVSHGVCHRDRKRTLTPIKHTAGVSVRISGQD